MNEYVQGRPEADDSFYKHPAINTQSHTFANANYVNTMVLSSLLEKFEALYRERTNLAKHYGGSSPQNAAGYLPSGEIPEAAASVTGDLPSREIPEARRRT